MNNIEVRLHEIPGGQVLDVAAGRGDSALAMADILKDYDSVIGVDMVQASLVEARGKVDGKPIHFACMTGTRLAFPDDAFDTVTIHNSLHHLDRVEAVLAEMYRVTRPGGRIMIFEMYRDNLTEPQKTHVLLHHWWAAIDTRAGISHYETFSRRELVDVAAPLNLRDTETYDWIEKPGDLHDPETIAFLEKTIATYPDKIKSHPDHDRLREEGELLRNRLHRTGIAWANQLVFFGKK